MFLANLIYLIGNIPLQTQYTALHGREAKLKDIFISPVQNYVQDGGRRPFNVFNVCITLFFHG